MHCFRILDLTIPGIHESTEILGQLSILWVLNNICHFEVYQFPLQLPYEYSHPSILSLLYVLYMVLQYIYFFLGRMLPDNPTPTLTVHGKLFQWPQGHHHLDKNYYQTLSRMCSTYLNTLRTASLRTAYNPQTTSSTVAMETKSYRLLAV